MPISETRIRILTRLAERNLDRDGAEAAEEIRLALGRRTKGWANGPLREMAWHGLVAGLGVSMSGARTWTITEKGRGHLALALASLPSPALTTEGA